MVKDLASKKGAFQRMNKQLKEEDEMDGTSLVKHNRYLKFLTNVLNKKCKKCNSLKPPGSHHCSTCQACIARMDHHCPWVNNCVGYYNQKFFLQLLVVSNGEEVLVEILPGDSL